VEISAKELRQMASTVDEMHHESMRTFKDETAALHADLARSARRGFMKKAGIGGAALALGPALLPTASLLASAGAAGLDDPTIAVYAESIELAAVDAYSAAAGLLTDATKPVALVFQQHHRDHAQAFAAVATALGGKPTGKANAALLTAAGPLLAAAKSETDALNIAYVIENQAAATYAFALTALVNADAIAGTATILPIEAEHAVILGITLGKAVKDLFPNGAFESAAAGELGDPTKALDPAKYPVG
jgi:rubrerythrin